jgi:hypothetical protein
MLSAFGESGWRSIPDVPRIRLEEAIIDDITNGRRNYYAGANSGGSLGTWARSFWRYFDSPEQILDNLLEVLRYVWDGQNYVGHYFMPLLAKLATDPVKRSLAIERLKSAVENDAYTLKKNLEKLPVDWYGEIREDEEPEID